MSNVCKHQCPIFSGVCKPSDCEVIKDAESIEKHNDYRQELFDYLASLHVTAVESEMNEIEDIVKRGLGYAIQINRRL